MVGNWRRVAIWSFATSLWTGSLEGILCRDALRESAFIDREHLRMSPACCRMRTVSFLLLLLLGLPAATLAQEAKLSVRVASVGSPAGTPLFKVDIVESTPYPGLALSSLTLVDTASGPRLTNLALTLPQMTIGNAAIAPKVGDQQLPGVFGSSLLAGTSLKRPVRGLSFSTHGSVPWSFSVGQLESGAGVPAWSSSAPSFTALAVGLTPHKRWSLAPRLLVPMSSAKGAQTSIGTALRAELTPHLAVISDVGAAAAAQAGWAPLAAARLVGQWAGAELETNVLRGAPWAGTEGAATIGTLDREVARGLVRPIDGLTISGLLSWSRPADPSQPADRRLGTFGFTYDRMPFGLLAVTSQRELNSPREVNTMLVMWRQTAGGFAVRYTEKREEESTQPMAPVFSRLVEIDFPNWPRLDPRNRVEIRTVMTVDPSSSARAISSRLKGRFDVTGEIGLVGETELGLATGGGAQAFQILRLTSEVPVVKDTAVQLLYNCRRGTLSPLNQSFEARVSRTIHLFR